MRFAALILALVAIGITTSPAKAVEPIEGKWKNGPVDIVAITPCGESFCLKMASGEYAGQSIGKLRGKGLDYSGDITDPADQKTYSGSGTVSGTTLKLKGCALKIFCQTVVWNRL
ncbi:DUF2147 domain-containing protein [Agrobacterium rubi]|uniref:DUF2147 domain-containing protein n=1 Tax=Agrobacterium rubi TaxID=28099 RepID=A0AAE7R6T0_9HYPH|nr:DUF2147 domain-containing protein [Agrobacterium rubi]NTE88411.1 DUF2147 domain-containing protein [Agrobacterium rubi]NTF04177.1 DUF2147 domain-containing protein [Agrobacterium rubi]NTF09591.1 DUF2147 domain-containing protein [Agrobacterium rubi]NTF22498.1 DUF2147 domain-containing protein [Agrobacterium rubi]NTF29355.1 DUF2147 domain-containing protein [Agrobacterium rubi]